MTVTEVLLLIFGAAIFVVSFFIPEKGESEESGGTLSREQVKELFEEEVKDAKDTVLEMVNETVSYGVEKAERAMERLTNEKISAVSEFSDTVLTDINKNREEVLFLYDMLNDKHESLKEAVVRVEQTTMKASKVNSELEQKLTEKTEDVAGTKLQGQEWIEPELEKQLEERVTDFIPFESVKLEQLNAEGMVIKEADESVKKNAKKKKKPTNSDEGLKPEFFVEGNVVNQGNSNEKILELHRMNKSNVAIAKELGLGVGEVKLVIDLYEGMK